MTKTDDLTGKDFSYWHVLKKVSDSGAAKWLCRCKCGTERVVLARSLKPGASRSCGCLNRERTSALGHNLLGKTFGNLLVIAQEHTNPVRVCVGDVNVCYAETSALQQEPVSNTD